MPAEGGEARRLTYHSASDIPSSFTADDKGVLFSSARQDTAANVQFPMGLFPSSTASRSPAARPPSS